MWTEPGGQSWIISWERYPSIQMLEVLMPDMNGIFRCKRIHRSEFAALFAGSLKCPGDPVAGHHHGGVRPPGRPAPGGGSPTTRCCLSAAAWPQVPPKRLPDGAGAGEPLHAWRRTGLGRPTPRTGGRTERFVAMGLRPVIATELEFYLVSPGMAWCREPLLGRIPGTAMEQQGIQFALAEDMWQYDAFLDAVRIACEQQSVPMTTMLSGVRPGQWEINTRHVDDPCWPATTPCC